MEKYSSIEEKNINPDNFNHVYEFEDLADILSYCRTEEFDSQYKDVCLSIVEYLQRTGEFKDRLALDNCLIIDGNNVLYAKNKLYRFDMVNIVKFTMQDWESIHPKIALPQSDITEPGSKVEESTEPSKTKPQQDVNPNTTESTQSQTTDEEDSDDEICTII